MKLKFLNIFLCFSLIVTFPVLALDLHEARKCGVIGEKADGYVIALKETPEAQQLVKEVNAKRKQEYARIAQEKGQAINVVAKLASLEIIKNLESGVPYQDDSGRWKKR